MSAFEGKADISFRIAKCLLITEADISALTVATRSDKISGRTGVVLNLKEVVACAGEISSKLLAA